MFYLNLMVNGVVEGLIIGLAALALNLVFAVGRFPNAASGDFMTIGAYAGYSVQQLGSHSALVQGLAAVAASVAVSLASYALVFRHLVGRSMVAPLLASIGLGLFYRSIVSLLFGLDPLFFVMPPIHAYTVAGLRLQGTDLWLATLAAASVAIVLLLLHVTPIGREMRAVADNALLARASGIRSRRVMIALWSMVGAITGIAGLVVALRTTVNPELGWGLLLPAFAAAVLGGVGSPAGAILAGLLLGVMQELSTPWLGFSYKIALSFVVLTVVLLVRPQGLFGTAQVVR
ncbi:MAG TPA: branched-chain amino acid ABC transporter permease [Casimicrobiaceae bacterium]|nr:branched-chain amino acid ABC transporter permease [Casimicrobiaceae bacterium]